MSSITDTMTPRDLTGLLVTAIQNRYPVLIKGKPGQGKTDVTMQSAAKAKAQWIVGHPVVDSPIDYKGMPVILEDKNGEKYATFLPFGNLQKLIEAKKPTVYVLDDLGQAAKAVQAAAMQLLLARRINGHAVSDFVTFIACTNNKDDKAGVQGILEPVKSRFKTIIELIPSLEDWCRWAAKNKMPQELISFIRFRPDFLTGFEPTSDITNSSCPRTIAAVGDWLNAGLPKAIELTTFTGAAGVAFATEFKGFLDLYRSLPDIKDILSNPSTAEVPGEMHVIYAVCGALSHRATPKLMDAILTYGERLEEEFMALLVRDCIYKNKKNANVEAYRDWVIRHPDILID